MQIGRIVGISALVVVCGTGLIAQTARPKGNVMSTTFEAVNAAAAGAKRGDRAKTQELSDAIWDTFSPVTVPPNHAVRERLFRAQAGYKTGTQPRVTEQDAVAAINDLMDALCAPDWAHTNVAQFHLFRTILKPLLPQVVGQEPNGKKLFGISDHMSPAEGVLVSLYLVRGKAYEDSFQVPPDEWVRRIRDSKQEQIKTRRGHERSPNSGGNTPTLTHQLVPLEIPRTIQTLRNGIEGSLTDPNSTASRGANAFLTRLGIQK